MGGIWGCLLQVCVWHTWILLWVPGSHVWEVERQPSLGGVGLPWKEQVCTVGVLLDSTLWLEAQEASVARRAFFFFKLQLVLQLRPISVRDHYTPRTGTFKAGLLWCALRGAIPEDDWEIPVSSKCSSQIPGWVSTYIPYKPCFKTGCQFISGPIQGTHICCLKS